MVRFSAHGSGTHVIGFGITEENVHRLKEGEPISVDLAEHGIPDTHVVIFYGEDEEALAEKVRPYVSDETIVSETEEKKWRKDRLRRCLCQPTMPALPSGHLGWRA